MGEMVNLNFFNQKKIMITGHTGFKGSWLCHILKETQASILGYSLKPMTTPSLFSLSGLNKSTFLLNTVIGDVRDLKKLQETMTAFQPEIVIHLAAQPLVREAYENPVLTYETNVMGTVNFLEAIRQCHSIRSVLNVTTDKVYENKEWLWGYRENDVLNGYDPYSNSKSCSELVTQSYKQSFFKDRQIAISTARAGNVIGGGDFSKDRIIPDSVRATEKNETIQLRNPDAIRPYQHVLEPLFAYLLILQKQYEDPSLADDYNVGPDEKDCIDTKTLVSLFCKQWGANQGFAIQKRVGPHEAGFLKLDCSKIKTKLQWQPHWSIKTAIEKTVDWTKAYQKNENIKTCMKKQIRSFIKDQDESKGVNHV